MKNFIVMALLGVSTIGAATPAFAGPDWQLIEQGRRAKIAQFERERAMKTQASQGQSPSETQRANKDAQMDKMMQDCAAMMKK